MILAELFADSLKAHIGNLTNYVKAHFSCNADIGGLLFAVNILNGYSCCTANLVNNGFDDVTDWSYIVLHRLDSTLCKSNGRLLLAVFAYSLQPFCYALKLTDVCFDVLCNIFNNIFIFNFIILI